MDFDTITIKTIDFIKTNKVTLPLYRKLKSRQNNKRFKIDSIKKISPLASKEKDVRFNLVLPSLRKTRVFAGISSALSFFLKLTEGIESCRIIVIGAEQFDKKMTYRVPGYEHSKTSSKRILFVSEDNQLEVGENDIFVLTSWKTAVSFKPIFQFQKEAFHIAGRKLIYLIQDFEPGFFAWSSEYVLAESTYSEGAEDIIAVFNSFELAAFFEKLGYCFYSTYYFNPTLNPSLKSKLIAASQKKQPKREKKILIYGRPSEARNAFEIIRYSLNLWSKEYADASQWEIVSLGEGFDNIELDHNVIVSKGKVSLDEYADHMLTAYAGISLMVSPHPSYPPLEMSTFGIRTITNKFFGKDLSGFNENILSIDSCSPILIAKKLAELCDEYDLHESKLILNTEYLEGKSLENVTEIIRNTALERTR